jgi:hypothetical protein
MRLICGGTLLYEIDMRVERAAQPLPNAASEWDARAAYAFGRCCGGSPNDGTCAPPFMRTANLWGV